jgi:hypothetical protein
MIIRAGFQSFEFQRSFELPKPLTFASHEEALVWLKRLGFQDPQTILRFREYLRHFSDDPESFRLTDHQAVERMAELLASGKVAVVVREQRGGSAPATSQPAAVPVAFPLSERVSRAPSASFKPAPAADPPTFDSTLDSVVQAAALAAAADEGMAFCPE